MDRIRITLLIAAILVGNVLHAQKYLSTENEKIVKEYRGVSFSSEVTLFENLNESGMFSKFAELLEAHGTATFSDGFMGTVFVIPDSTFERVAEENETLDLNDPVRMKELLHFMIVPGRVDNYSIRKAIDKSGGVAYFKTVSGEKLRIKLLGDKMVIIDSNGNTAEIIATNFYHSNGFFHIADGIVFPDGTE